MSKTVTFQMPGELHTKLKAQAARSGTTFKGFCNAVLKEAASKDVLVQFSLVPSEEVLKQAANFSERSETPEIED